ncbi:hypothetical protein DSBG_3259 [Desulfosporosinus sp. BG]|nr:hypothetical protein DSBG_3259 [Desulfosporosinus sp. BG]
MRRQCLRRGAGQSLRPKKALEGGVHVKAYVRYVSGLM